MLFDSDEHLTCRPMEIKFDERATKRVRRTQAELPTQPMPALARCSATPKSLRKLLRQLAEETGASRRRQAVKDKEARRVRWWTPYEQQRRDQ